MILASLGLKSWLYVGYNIVSLIYLVSHFFHDVKEAKGRGGNFLYYCSYSKTQVPFNFAEWVIKAYFSLPPKSLNNLALVNGKVKANANRKPR